MAFDKRQTNIAKGIAILLLLWHHLFFNSNNYYGKFISAIPGTNIPVECYLADFCKVCVAIFLLLSGYGLMKSYQKSICKDNSGVRLCDKNNFKFVWNHWIKMMSGYWFIYIIFVPLGLLFGRNFIDIYGTNPLSYIFDFLGISYLSYGVFPLFNVTWWFMGMIVLLYFLFSLIVKLINWQPEIILVVSFLFTFIYFFDLSISYWFAPFVFGMYIAHNEIFEKINNRCNTIIKRFLLPFSVFLVMAYIRFAILPNNLYFDSIFAFSIVLFSYLIISKIPIISSILFLLGKHSANIFMFHTFIFEYYFSSFIYGFKYSLLIYFVMIIVCLAISVTLEFIKKKIKYDKLFAKIKLSYC